MIFGKHNRFLQAVENIAEAEPDLETSTAETPENSRCGGERGPLQLWLLASCYRLRRVARSLSHRCCIALMPY